MLLNKRLSYGFSAGTLIRAIKPSLYSTSHATPSIISKRYLTNAMKKELHECEVCGTLFKLSSTEEMFVECVGVCAPTVCHECKERAKEAERVEQEGE